MATIPTLKRSKGDPKIPIDYTDPTELGRIRGGAVRQINKRFNVILKNVKAYIRENIKPTGSKTVNSQLTRYYDNGVIGVNHLDKAQYVANETIFDYLFGDTEYDNFKDFLNGLLYATLLSNAFSLSTYSRSYRVTIIQWNTDWWFNDYMDKSLTKGLSDVIQSAKYQSTSNIVGDTDLANTVRNISAETLTNTTSYQSRLRTAEKAAFANMQSLTAGLNDQLAEILRTSVKQGLSQSQIIDKVTKSLIESDKQGEGGARKRARLLVRNRINNARREEGRQTTTQLNNEVYADTEYEMRLLWFSALMPNRTRYWHGSRHGKTYTVKQVEDFYSNPGDRSNCYCHQTNQLVYKATGEPVVESKLFEQMQKQRAIFDSMQTKVR